MEISSSLASKNYKNVIPAIEPSGGSTNNDTQSSFASVAREFVTTLQNGEDTAKDGLSGKADAHSVVEALAATELAVETAITVRDKVVEAYQEILRMPV